MSLAGHPQGLCRDGVPRASGDEPEEAPFFFTTLPVFPARAGMSHETETGGRYRVSVPRASGDEPVTGSGMDERSECSPRERG